MTRPTTPDASTPVGTRVRCVWTGDELTITAHLGDGQMRLSDGSLSTRYIDWEVIDDGR